jgi:hypothetical protein
MIIKVVGDSSIATNIAMDKQHEGYLVVEAMDAIFEAGVDGAFAILPPYRRRFVTMALLRILDGLDAIAAWERGDLDWPDRELEEADMRDWLAAEAEANALAAAEKEERDSLAAPPHGSLDPESSDYFRDHLTADHRAAIEAWAHAVPEISRSHKHTKCKRKAERQSQPEMAKRKQCGGTPNAVGKEKAVQKHGIPGT